MSVRYWVGGTLYSLSISEIVGGVIEVRESSLGYPSDIIFQFPEQGFRGSLRDVLVQGKDCSVVAGCWNSITGGYGPVSLRSGIESVLIHLHEESSYTWVEVPEASFREEMWNWLSEGSE